MEVNLDDSIAQKEAELKNLRTKMDQCKEQFIKATADFASITIKNIAMEYTGRFSEHCLSMTEEKRSEFTKAVLELVQKSDVITRNEFSKQGLWWHLEPHLYDSSEKYTQIDDKYPEIIDRTVRRILGHLGIILERYGFRVTACGRTSTFYEFWFERPIISEDAIPSYPHLLTWSESMQQIMQQYNTYYQPALKCFKDLKDLTDEKRKQQALSMWSNPG
jgi:hypothetical protein